MIFLKSILILCFVAVLVGATLDVAFLIMSRLLGGFALIFRPAVWSGLLVFLWLFVLAIGWLVLRRLHVPPFT